MKDKEKPDESHIFQLDSLRAIAIILVLICHSWGNMGTPNIFFLSFDLTPFFNMGKSGVQLFFVLSGYLLYRSTAKNFQWSKVTEYFKRRFLRITPAYYLSILFCLILSRVDGLHQLWTHMLFLQTLSLNTLWGINGSYWSLGPEIQFYIFLPLVLATFAFLKIRTGTKERVFSIITLAIVGVLLRLHYCNTANADILSMNFPLLTDSFAIGMLVSEMEKTCPKLIQFRPWSLSLLTIAALAFFVAVSFYIFRLEVRKDLAYSSLGWIIKNLLISISYASFLIISLNEHQNKILKRIFYNRLVGNFGLISYGIFLFHQPILESKYFTAAVTRYDFLEHSLLLRLALLSVVVYPIAWLCFRYVEAPLLKRKV